MKRLGACPRCSVRWCCCAAWRDGTGDEAARVLGCTQGSLKGNLQRGRQRLQERLRRRGIALPAALAILEVSRGEAAWALLIRHTVTAARSAVGNSARRWLTAFSRRCS